MKNLKNQKGITLVALVVTIIVLLILAGVSLSLVAGSNGIITKASNASKENTVATAKEQVTLQIAEWTTDFYEEVYVNRTEDVNKKAGDWIYEEKKASEASPNKTTDDYMFYITQNSSGNKASVDPYKYVVIITGSKVTSLKDGSVPNSERGTSKDERLSQDIVGYITEDGKLSWESWK